MTHENTYRDDTYEVIYSEPTYWTILFVMLKIYFIYKVAGKKIQKGYIKFNYVICPWRYVRGYLQGSENGRVVTIAFHLIYSVWWN
jgi:hypothetical protein